MKMYDMKYKILHGILYRAVKTLREKGDIEEMKRDIYGGGYMPSIAVLRALERLERDIERKYNREMLMSGAVFVLWKACMSSNYRYMVAEFLQYMKEELAKIDLDPFRRPPSEWKSNIYWRNRGK